MLLDWSLWGRFALAMGVAALVTLAIAMALKLAAHVLAKKHPVIVDAFAAPRRHVVVLASIIATQIAVVATWPETGFPLVVRHILAVLIVVAAALLASSIINALIGEAMARHPVLDDKDQDSRRLNTQLTLVRGLLVAAVWLVATGIALFTIPGAHAIGTSLLASAGLASVVAGIAAQSVLGNLFAGLQIAFSGSIRVGDVVIVQGEYGHIRDIKLTSVVVRTWDERSLVVPSTYFTTTPFENWTLTDSQLMGTVVLDVDWRVHAEAMRERLGEILAQHELWDGRAQGLIIEDATGGMVRVRATVSADDAPSLFTLRHQVREALVDWVATQQVDSLPVARTLAEVSGEAGSSFIPIAAATREDHAEDRD